MKADRFLPLTLLPVASLVALAAAPSKEALAHAASTHKFDIAYKDHPWHAYIGLQDHGSPCWFKSIKLRQLKRSG